MLLFIAWVFILMILEERHSQSPESKATVKMASCFLVVIFVLSIVMHLVCQKG